jgi:archaellum component FlaC
MDLFLKLEMLDKLDLKIGGTNTKVDQIHQSLARLEKTVDAIKKVLDEAIPAITEFLASRNIDVMELIVADG